MNTCETINLDDYKQIGEGGNGKTYVNPAAPGEILKVNNARMSTWEAVNSVWHCLTRRTTSA